MVSNINSFRFACPHQPALAQLIQLIKFEGVSRIQEVSFRLDLETFVSAHPGQAEREAGLARLAGLAEMAELGWLSCLGMPLEWNVELWCYSRTGCGILSIYPS